MMEFSVSKRMKHLVLEALGPKSFKRMPGQTLKPADQVKWLDKAKDFPKKIKHKHAEMAIIFSDETPLSLGETDLSDSGFYEAVCGGDVDAGRMETMKECHHAGPHLLQLWWRCSAKRTRRSPVRPPTPSNSGRGSSPGSG